MLEIIILTLMSLIITLIYLYDVVTGAISKNDSPRFRKLKDIVYYFIVLYIIIAKTIEAYAHYFKH